MNREQLKLLVEEVGKEMLDEVSILKNKNPFKAMYVLGPAGAGKTHIVNNFLGLPSNFKNINSDDAVESVFPLFNLSLTFASSEVQWLLKGCKCFVWSLCLATSLCRFSC